MSKHCVTSVATTVLSLIGIGVDGPMIPKARQYLMDLISAWAAMDKESAITPQFSAQLKMVEAVLQRVHSQSLLLKASPVRTSANFKQHDGSPRVSAHGSRWLLGLIRPSRAFLSDADLANSHSPVSPIADPAPPKNPRSDGYGLNPRCLRRDIGPYLCQNQATSTIIAKLITGSSSIGIFQDTMQAQGGVHVAGHVTIGADPGGDFYTSPNDPAFWLHHGMIDRTWSIWQSQDLPNRMQVIAGGTSVSKFWLKYLRVLHANAYIDVRRWSAAKADWYCGFKPFGLNCISAEGSHEYCRRPILLCLRVRCFLRSRYERGSTW